MIEQKTHLLDSDKEAFRIDEVARALSIGVSTLYRFCQAGRVPCRKFGSRVLIPREVVAKLLSGEIDLS